MTAYNVVIPEAGFLRLHQIIGNPKADPPIPALIPVSRSTWWAGVKDGRTAHDSVAGRGHPCLD